MASKVQLTFLDYSLEKSRVEFYMPEGSAANIEGIISESDFQTAGSVAATIAGLSLCTPIGEAVVASNNKSAETRPGSKYAQRELALLITYSDNVTGNNYHISVPGPDWENLAGADGETVNTAAVGWTAFVTAFEAHAKSPDGNAVTVVTGRLVGRNR